MSLDATLAVAAAAGAMVAMAAARVSADRALLAALAALVLADVIPAERALAGFANTGVATVALLFVVAAGVRRSGALAPIVAAVLGDARGPRRAQMRVMGPVALASGFLNNTPIVAMLLPELRSWGQRHGVAASQLLIPLSYAAIVGGMCTVIGTSTNLLVDGLVADHGMGHLGIFWISALGVPAAVAALVVVTALGPRLLPARGDREALADPRTFTAELVVDRGGPLDGTALSSVVAPGLRAFAPIEIRRGDRIVAAPRASEQLAGGDRLVFAAPSAELLAVRRVPGLSPAADDAPPPRDRTLVEAVVTHNCPLTGCLVGDGSFRRTYGAAVVAVIRDGRRKPAAELATWRLEAGDVVLLEADPSFVDGHRFDDELVLVTDHGRVSPHARWHGVFAVGTVVALATAVAFGAVSMLVAALAAAIAMFAGRVLTWQEAATDIDLRVLLAIVGAIGVGAALEDTGAAAVLAEGIVDLGGGSPWTTLALVYLATAISTELVTNNAAAVLMFPIALGAASELGASPWPFVATIMIAASASFVTPIGYQTNLMVYGPGGYRFADFARLGAPVSLAVAAVTIALAPILWPF